MIENWIVHTLTHEIRIRITTINGNKTINNIDERDRSKWVSKRVSKRNKQTNKRLQFNSSEFIKVNRSSALKLNEEEEKEVELNVNTKIEVWNLEFDRIKWRKKHRKFNKFDEWITKW